MRTNNILWRLIGIVAIFLIYSCTDEEHGQTSGKMMTFTGIIEEGYTRTIVSELQGKALEQGVKVGLFIGEDGTEEWTYDNAITVSAGNGTFKNEQKLYEPFSGRTNVYAYAPYQDAFTGKYDQDVNFSVQTDQTTNDGYLASDFLLGTADNPTSDCNIALKFSHQMTKIRINLVSDEYSLEGATVVLRNIVPTAKINLESKTIIADVTVAPVDIKVADFGNEDSDFDCAAIIVPQVLQAGTFFEIKLSDGNTFSYSLQEKMTFEAKKCYEYDITVGKPYVGEPNITDIQDVDRRSVIGALRGTLIRIVGHKLDKVTSVYCNGVKVVPVRQVQNYIALNIPADLTVDPSDEDYCKIRLELEEGQESIIKDFKFRDGSAPKINSVSWNLAKAGEAIILTGENFVHIEKILFPGNVEAATYEVKDMNTIEVVVPENGDQILGAITVIGLNGGAYSMKNINCQVLEFDWEIMEVSSSFLSKGQKFTSFVDAFAGISEDVQPVTKPEVLYGTLGMVYEGLYSNSDNDQSPVKSGFKIDWSTVAEKVGGNTSCSDLAFQCECYCPWIWTMGALRFSIVGLSGTEGVTRCTLNPWRVNGQDIGVDFQHSWKTVTVNLGDLKDLESKTVSEMATNVNTCFSFQLGWFNGSRGIAMEHFQMFFANPRIVPVTYEEYIE